jgi:hypothetical protein
MRCGGLRGQLVGKRVNACRKRVGEAAKNFGEAFIVREQGVIL